MLLPRRGRAAVAAGRVAPNQTLSYAAAGGPGPDGQGRDAELARAPRQAEIQAALADGPRLRQELLDAGLSASAMARLLEDGRVEPVEATAERPAQARARRSIPSSARPRPPYWLPGIASRPCCWPA
jgi:hypothetical protein